MFKNIKQFVRGCIDHKRSNRIQAEPKPVSLPQSMVSLDGVHQCSARGKVLCGSADTHLWSITDTQQMLFL